MTDYRVVRSRRRTVALQVDQSGSVVVRAPMALPAEEIRTFVEKHETWIHRQQQRQARYRAEHPEPTPQEQEALRRQAKTLLPQRVAYWAGVMGVRPTGIKITSARTRFGSCSGKNSLCFSLYLMAYPPEAIEYVVVHELAHIRHKNHSPAFYAEVERYLPDWRRRQAPAETVSFPYKKAVPGHRPGTAFLFFLPQDGCRSGHEPRQLLSIQMGCDGSPHLLMIGVQQRQLLL